MGGTVYEKEITMDYFGTWCSGIAFEKEEKKKKVESSFRQSVDCFEVANCDLIFMRKNVPETENPCH